MKVAVVNLACDPSLSTPDAVLDAYHSLTGWCAALERAGASVSAVQAFGEPALRRRDGVEYHFCRSSSSRLTVSPDVVDAVASVQADVVHVNGLDAPLQTWWLRRALPGSTALVVQDHASVPSRAVSVKAPIRRRAMAAVDGFLFTSLLQAKPWLDGGFIRSAEQVYEVLEASTSMAAFPPATARAGTGTGGSPSVLWVGRLTPNKDPLTVLAGFTEALADLPEATLTMIFGDGTLLPDVQRRVDSSGLTGRVRLVGSVPHEALAAWYSAADVFVLGSHREGSGYAAIEACACGAVPVLTDIPSFRMLTGGGAVGALWRPGSPSDLATALVNVCRADLPAHRIRVREHFETSLSWPVVGQRAYAVYQRVLEGRRRARLA